MRASRLLIDLCLGTFEPQEVSQANAAVLLEQAHQLRLESYLLQRLGPIQQQLGQQAEKWLPPLRRATARYALANLQADEVTREMLSRFERASIAGLLLKGSALRAQRREFTGRFQGDIDLLVSREDLDRAEQQLRNAGFLLDVGERTYEYYRTRHFHVPYEREGIRIELHWRVDRIAPAGFTERLFRRRRLLELEDGVYPVPAPEHELLLSLVHISRHAFAEGLRWLADISLSLPWPEETGSLVEEEARSWPPRSVRLPLWFLAAWGVDRALLGIETIEANFLDRRLLKSLVAHQLLGETWMGLPAWVSDQLILSWLGSSQSLASLLGRALASAAQRKLGHTPSPAN